MIKNRLCRTVGFAARQRLDGAPSDVWTDFRFGYFDPEKLSPFHLAIARIVPRLEEAEEQGTQL